MQCRELDIFKISGVIWEFFREFLNFSGIFGEFFGNSLGILFVILGKFFRNLFLCLNGEEGRKEDEARRL